MALVSNKGRHDTGGDPSVEADLLKARPTDAEIFTIGIRGNADRASLEDMASEPKQEHVYMFGDYTGLDALVTLLATGRVGGVIF